MIHLTFIVLLLATIHQQHNQQLVQCDRSQHHSWSERNVNTDNSIGIGVILSAELKESHLIPTTNTSRQVAPTNVLSVATNDSLEHKLELVLNSANITDDSSSSSQVVDRKEQNSPLNVAREQQLAENGRRRFQRSEGLVSRNNRDFYRPSTAPANLLIADPRLDLKRKQEVRDSTRFATSTDSINHPLIGAEESRAVGTQTTSSSPLDFNPKRPLVAEFDTLNPSRFTDNNGSGGEMLELERIRMVSRGKGGSGDQGMRDKTKQDEMLTNSKFVYDRPLTVSSQTNISGQLIDSKLADNKRLYSSTVDFTSLASTDGQLDSSVTDSRRQSLLKFQAQDARDQSLPDDGSQQNATVTRTILRHQAGKQSPVYEISAPTPNTDNNKRASALSKQHQSTGGKNAPPTGCTFYDTECKLLVGKLVRLPASIRQKSTVLTNSPDRTTQAEVSQQKVVDSSIFDKDPISPITVNQQQHEQPFSRLNVAAKSSPAFNRLSWNSEEQHRARHRPDESLVNWQHNSQDGEDIARIKGSKFSSQPDFDLKGTSKTTSHVLRDSLVNSMPIPQQVTPTHTASSAQILRSPVKNHHEPKETMSSRSNFTLYDSETQPVNIQHYLTGSLSASTYLPPIVSGPMAHHPGRLTNFTTIDETIEDIRSTEARQSSKSLPQMIHNEPSQSGQIPQAPAAHRKHPAFQQFQTINHYNNTGSLKSNPGVFNYQSTKGVKQPLTRTAARIQSADGHQQPQLFGSQMNQFPGDISITRIHSAVPRSNLTMARLGQLNQLATQASDQAPNLSGNFASTTSQSPDFFQDRTIAEIMADSGLRIDGQQVEFKRLKECLREANLLSLVAQATATSLTIFMPTDLAFDMFVQEQAMAHQRERGRQSSLLATSDISRSSAARSTWVVAQMPPKAVDAGDTTSGIRRDQKATASPTSGSSRLVNSGTGGSIAASRLTLDCSSGQVRQILLDHISVQLVTPNQLQKDTIISSLSGRRLLLSSVPSKKIVVVDGQAVIAATRAKNGMVYVVNKLLNLTQQLPNVIDLLETQSNLTTLYSYLNITGLANRLRRAPGPLTILAPTNDVFEQQLGNSARQLLNSDPDALMDLLRGHVVDGAQFGKLISMRNLLKTMNSGQNIEAKSIKPNIYLLDNQPTSMRLVGTSGNGVVIAIDRLIVPPWLKMSIGVQQDARPTVGSSTSSNSTSSQLDAHRGNPASSLLFTGELETSVAPDWNPRSHEPLVNVPADFGARESMRIQRQRAFDDSQRPTVGSTNPLVSNSASRANRNSPLNNNPLDSFNLPVGDKPPEEVSNHHTSATPIRSRLSHLRATTIADLSPSLGVRQPTTDKQLNSNFAQSSSNAMQLIEKLADLMEAKQFVKYLYRSRFYESLRPEMSYVILVPTDEAIEKLPRQIIDMLERNSERLLDLVNYHVIETTFERINTIPDGQTLSTLNDKDILFNWYRNSTTLTASGAVVIGGVQEKNIALLIVDRVLYPTPGTILDIISRSPILSNLTSLVRQAGFERQLSIVSRGPSSYTLFAPSDYAFSQIDKRELAILYEPQNGGEAARRVLLRHLSQPTVFTSSIALSNRTQVLLQQQVPTITTINLLGEELTLRQRNDDYFSVNDVTFSYADVAATNGVVHVIDRVL